MSTLGGCALMNAWATFFAALSRLGATSVAAMLPDTSMAMMTVPLAWDTGTVAAGPAVATASTAMPAIVNQTPASRARLPSAVATPAEASVLARRLVAATAAHARAAATARPTASRIGLAKVTSACAWCSPRPR